MKFLLAALNTKYIHSNPAIYSLRAYVPEEKRKHVELAEYTINNSVSEILADIYTRKPDVIGFSCYIWNITMILELVRELPKLLPQTPIWLGGPEVTYRGTELFAKYPGVTGIMVGEGEETFTELLDYYLEGEKELTSIPGLCLPGGFTASRELTDISSLPFLYENMDAFENKIIYYESSRGCPFRCSYCLSSIDKKVRLRNIETVKKELQFFLDHKVKQVKFVDRTFNCNHRHAISIWKYIIEHDNGVTNFHFEVSADILNEEELQLLSRMRPGLAQLEIGVQSTNPDTIKAINRTMNVEKLEQIVARINARKNVHQHLDLIAGLPYEDYDTFVNSFNRVYRMEPEQLQLGFLKLLRGSEMWDRAGEFGICCMDKPPYEVLYTKWLSYEDVLRLKKVEEMVEMYYNSNQFVHTIRFLEKAFPHPFAMYEALADFYEKKGYFIQSPARGYRYHVLLHFAVEQDEENEAIYKELLTYDMYLRENLKSRPDFASDLGSFKEESRAFYEKEAQERTLLQDYEAYDSKQLSKMTHLEAFYYPVWADLRGAESARRKSSALVLFDYKHRNPLNGDARTVVVG